MIRPLLLAVLTMFTLQTALFAQGDMKAQFKRIYPVANEQLESGKAERAAKNFLGLWELDPANAHINYKVGRAYLLINGQKSEAVPYFEKAVKGTSGSVKDKFNEEKAPLDAYFYLGRAYHLDSQFDNAIASYRKYLKEDGSVKRDRKIEVERLIQNCQDGKLIVESPISVGVENLGEVINSSFDEYAAVVDATESMLIFTSRRPTSTGGYLDVDDKYFEDIYVSMKEDGEWQKPVGIGPAINTEGHEASIGLSADGQELFIYRDDFGDGNIYVSEFKGSSWGEMRMLNENINTPFRETHASVSSDGQTLYFTSDRYGQGGMDIFRSNRLPTGEWGLAENLGEVVNTKYDEEAPFIHPDGKTLFFSSKGHNSMGGYDIFFSILQDDGKWSTPMNIGHPMNTADDEYFFVMSPDGKRAYYSSTSGDGFGGKDIYLVNLDLDRDVPVTVYKGAILPNEQGDRPSDVTITVKDKESEELVGIYRPRPDNGRFVLILHPGQSYVITYEADGHQFKSESLFVPEDTSYFEINRAVKLTPIKVSE